MKNKFLTLSLLSAILFAGCGDSYDYESGERLQEMRAEIAEQTAAENAINSELIFNKWWDDPSEYGSADQFFDSDGVYKTDIGKPGTWKWIEEGKTMLVVDNGEEVNYEIISVTEDELKVKAYDAVFTYVTKKVNVSEEDIEKSNKLTLSAFNKGNEGNFEEATKDLNEAIALNPNSSDAYSYRAMIKKVLKNYDAALIDFNTAIRLDPNFVNCYTERGRLKRELNQLNEAIADFDKAIELGIEGFDAYYYRGTTKGDLKQFEAALKDFDEVLKINPNHPATYYFIGLCNIQLNNTEEGCIALHKAQDLGDKDAASLIEQYCK